jgi:hypothetical protein
VILAHNDAAYLMFAFAKWYRFVQNFAAGFKWYGGSTTAISCWISGILINIATGVFMCSVPHLATERWGVVCRGWKDHLQETKYFMWFLWFFSILYTVLFVYEPRYFYINESGEACT